MVFKICGWLMEEDTLVFRTQFISPFLSSYRYHPWHESSTETPVKRQDIDICWTYKKSFYDVEVFKRKGKRKFNYRPGWILKILEISSFYGLPISVLEFYRFNIILEWKWETYKTFLLSFYWTYRPLYRSYILRTYSFSEWDSRLLCFLPDSQWILFVKALTYIY